MAKGPPTGTLSCPHCGKTIPSQFFRDAPGGQKAPVTEAEAEKGPSEVIHCPFCGQLVKLWIH